MDSVSDDPSAPSPAGLGVSGQACNECRRRKAKCDRTLPECGLCGRHRRHCLYEQHSKTPLTRKHLTEVETKLRRAEARVRVAEGRAALALAASGPNGRHPPAAQADRARPLLRTPTSDVLAVNLDMAGVDDWQAIQATDLPTHSHTHSQAHSSSSLGHTSHASNTANEALINRNEQPVGSLESPPRATDDFSWDEQSPQTSAWQRHATDGNTTNYGEEVGEEKEDDDGRAADGMATLNTEERDAGYLGLASGAAMLRLLLPDGETKERAHIRRSTVSSQPRPTVDAPMDASIPTPLYQQLQIAKIDVDAAIDAYFGLYHLSYPIVHEPTFRAQYSQIIPRPASSSWNALGYMIAAIGAWTAAGGTDTTDLSLFMAAKSNISADSLETGNITLVQVLTLMSNYLQKRDKPNSGYNYLGLALHMAMGLGLHKAFSNWKIPALSLEIRRRVWWCLFVFYTGAAITFGRPVVWPHREDVLPLNVRDRDLTHISQQLPEEFQAATLYSSVIIQARFHLATNEIYDRIIRTPQVPVADLLHLDDAQIGGWLAALPPWYTESASIPSKFEFSHSVMMWRCRNFRIIMYRSFVIKRAFQTRDRLHTHSPTLSETTAYDRCLDEARATIASIHSFWTSSARNRLSAWYALYFIFQASLIPCVCLRNDPTSPVAADWKAQIHSTLEVIQNMRAINPGSQDCYDVLMQLCGPFLDGESSNPADLAALYPTEESPATQISNVYSMFWPNVDVHEANMMDVGIWGNFMGEDLQMDPIQNAENLQ